MSSQLDTSGCTVSTVAVSGDVVTKKITLLDWPSTQKWVMGDGVEKFFAGTGLIDVVLAATLLEWMALEMWWRITGKGLDPVNLRLVLLAGLALMLAVVVNMMTMIRALHDDGATCEDGDGDDGNDDDGECWWWW